MSATDPYAAPPDADPVTIGGYRPPEPEPAEQDNGQQASPESQFEQLDAADTEPEPAAE